MRWPRNIRSEPRRRESVGNSGTILEKQIDHIDLKSGKDHPAAITTNQEKMCGFSSAAKSGEYRTGSTRSKTDNRYRRNDGY